MFMANDDLMLERWKVKGSQKGVLFCAVVVSVRSYKSLVTTTRKSALNSQTHLYVYTEQ